MRLRALKTRRRLRQCRCITSDYISRLPHRTAPGPLSLSLVSPRFRFFFFFLRFRLLERERGPGFEAKLLLANRFRVALQPDTRYKTPFHASFRTSIAIPSLIEPRPGRIFDRSW